MDYDEISSQHRFSWGACSVNMVVSKTITNLAFLAVSLAVAIQMRLYFPISRL